MVGRCPSFFFLYFLIFKNIWSITIHKPRDVWSHLKNIEFWLLSVRMPSGLEDTINPTIRTLSSLRVVRCFTLSFSTLWVSLSWRIWDAYVIKLQPSIYVYWGPVGKEPGPKMTKFSHLPTKSVSNDFNPKDHFSKPRTPSDSPRMA